MFHGTTTLAREMASVEGTVDHVEYCTALDAEVVRFASAMSSLSLDADVPTCPGWTVRDLGEHLGVIHRWAEELVRLRSPARISRLPLVDRNIVSSTWIEEGGRTLVATLRAADPNDEMWAWGLDQHVRFWSRRQLHETLVHRMDLELAADRSPRADPAIALDAIDEYLSNIEKVGKHSAELAALHGRGERLAFRDSEKGSFWSITLDEDGFSVSRDAGVFDAELVSSPVNLLLVILGRRAVDSTDVVVTGRRQLVDFWLENSAFE
jgi:uncharacterized protein (TIGR03083 family)